MEKREFKGPKSLKKFLEEKREEERKRLYDKALDFFVKDNKRDALITILELIRLSVNNENMEINQEEMELMKKLGYKSNETSEDLCFKGWQSLIVLENIPKATMYSIELQNLIKKEKREPTSKERDFITTVKDFIERNSKNQL
ncbi:MAG TPA: hypothetical protein VGO63_00815 [Candidatus Paceibacterota bacterium]|jgi:hypothetical protein|nr:hypothetical protein [Candidatus Paceibacterota bacterium]